MIAELKFHDVPSMSDMTRYYDGELLFADNITSVPKLMQVFISKPMMPCLSMPTLWWIK